ncbi:hypothetical protein B296_00000024 [Ensete ventricosum]|uniref:Uncharacterized protein n=1 Tax=Ensete ventricosum TaxID=4639 RepID=A0A427AM87_ENSVE|nr:hypothetical protein B296_00000024 [Ensete ventricosum]
MLVFQLFAWRDAVLRLSAATRVSWLVAWLKDKGKLRLCDHTWLTQRRVFHPHLYPFGSPVSTAALVFTSVLYRRILSCNMTSGAVLAARPPPFPFADPGHRRLQLHRRRLRLRWPTEVHLHSGDVPVGLDVLVVDGEDSILVRADLTLGGDRARLLCLGGPWM